MSSFLPAISQSGIEDFLHPRALRTEGHPGLTQEKEGIRRRKMNTRKKHILSGVAGLEKEGVRCNKGENKTILQTFKCEVLKSQLSKDSVLKVWGESGKPEPLLYLGQYTPCHLSFDHSLCLLSLALTILESSHGLLCRSLHTHFGR